MVSALLLVVFLAAAPAWHQAAPGAQHARIDQDGVAIELLRFDLERFRPHVVVLGDENPKTAAAVRSDTGAIAALNGGFFDTDWRSLGLRISAGKTHIGLRPRVDWGVLVVQSGRARIVHSREFVNAPDIDTAIQVGPRIVVGKQPMRLKPQTARRTAVALDGDGRFFTVVVTHSAVSAQSLADTLAQLEFESALMFDGGPSSQLSAAIGSLRIDIPGAYAVPDVVIVQPRRQKPAIP